ENDFAWPGGESESGAVFGIELEGAGDIEIRDGNFAGPRAGRPVVGFEVKRVADDGVSGSFFLVAIAKDEDGGGKGRGCGRLVKCGKDGRMSGGRRNLPDDFDWPSRGEADPAITAQLHYDRVRGSVDFGWRSGCCRFWGGRFLDGAVFIVVAR